MLRHCERSEAIQSVSAERIWIASLRSQDDEASCAKQKADVPRHFPDDAIMPLFRPTAQANFGKCAIS
nr:hypothetical protein FNV92_19515 [Bradyrhizobium cosmicum]